MTRPLSRRRAIEAAIAAYNSANPRRAAAAQRRPAAGRHVSIRETCANEARRPSLRKEFSQESLTSMLRRLVGAGFLSRHRVAKVRVPVDRDR